jgi:hypothetical protein
LDNNGSDTFIVLDSLNSVLYPDNVNEVTNEFTFFIPKGISISIVAYRKNGDKHYLGIDRTKSDSQNIFVRQLEMPLDKIRNEVKELGKTANKSGFKK